MVLEMSDYDQLVDPVVWGPMVEQHKMVGHVV